MKGVAKGKTKRRARKERITVLLATNGQVTEQEYLKWLSQEVHKRRRQELSVKITFIEGEPERMLEKLTARANKASEYDELWLVFDADGKDRTSLLRKCERCVLASLSAPKSEKYYPPRPGTMMPVLMRRLLGAKERQ